MFYVSKHVPVRTCFEPFYKAGPHESEYVVVLWLCGFGAQLQEERCGRAIQGAVPSEVTGTPVAHFAN